MSDQKVWTKIDTRTLFHGGEWDDIATGLRAKTFEVMLELAERVKHYRSDLYHDAMWLEERLTGPMQYDWIARESGTFIGEVVAQIALSEWDGSVKYRFELLNDERRWMLNVYEAISLSSACL